MNRAPAELACPKCNGSMIPKERQGVVIEVCRDCRGVYLDRGELDQLLDLEAVSVMSGQDADPRWTPPRDDRGPRSGRDDHGAARDGRSKRTRGRGSFLSDLFGGFGD